jgi:hypothetical protein
MTAILLIFVAQLGSGTQVPERDTWVAAVQEGVNWYRRWWGEAASASLMQTKSDAWAAVMPGRIYITLPDVGLAVNLEVHQNRVRIHHVDLLRGGLGGEEAIKEYIRRLQAEASHVSSGKADRFDTGRRTPQDSPLHSAERHDVQVIALGNIRLPIREPEPISREEHIRLMSLVRTVLESDPALSVCRPIRAVIPQLGMGDPQIYVLLENGANSCTASIIIMFERRGSSWRHEKLRNRFGDLDDLIGRIRHLRSSTLVLDP